MAGRTGAADVGVGLDDILGEVPGLQDVWNAHAGVRGVGDVRGRFRRFIRSVDIWLDLQLMPEGAGRRSGRPQPRPRPQSHSEVTTKFSF